MKNARLNPGEIIFCTEPHEVTTLLGSCIAICLYDKKLHTGGMCHYFLPRDTQSGEDPNMFGEYAIPNLLKKFKRNGSSPSDLSAKIIGGAQMVQDQSGLNPKSTDKSVGAENIKISEELLAKFGIKIDAKSIGGISARNIKFNTSTGEVEMKLTNQSVSGDNKTQNAPKTEVGTKKKIKVMIVDDSRSMRKVLRQMIEKNSDKMEILHEACDAFEAEEFMKKDPPDVITLDINMPKKDGVTFLKEYMATQPIPTIMVSAISYAESGPVFDALEFGAFDYIKKPAFSELDSLATDLYEKITVAFNSKFISKKRKIVVGEKERVTVSSALLDRYLVAIGSSTGGPESLKEILINLPDNIPPIIITQHIPPVFSKALAERLNTLCSFEVVEAKDGDTIKPGHVYIAPGDFHMQIILRKNELMIRTNTDDPVNSFRPSVDYMFNSLPELSGKKTLGILLTGMGADGAQGLKNIKDKGAVTIAQDEKTSVVYGMPKVAKEIGAASQIQPLDKIAGAIVNFVNNS